MVLIKRLLYGLVLVLTLVLLSSNLQYVEGAITYSGGIDIKNSISSVFVSGNYAYLGIWRDDDKTFHVVDISNPSNPQKLGSLNMGSIRTLSYAGYCAYPIRVQNGWTLCELNNTVQSIYVLGNKAYVGVSSLGGDCYNQTETKCEEFKIVDILDANNPKIISSLELGWYQARVNSVYVLGNYAYVGTNSAWGTINGQEFFVIDVSDPMNPKKLGGIDFSDGYNYYGEVYSVYAVGNKAYVGTGSPSGDFYIIDVSTPSSPTKLSSLKVGGVKEIHVSGSYAYLGISNGEFKIVDISDPLNPRVRSTLNLVPNTVTALFVSGDYAYVGYPQLYYDKNTQTWISVDNEFVVVDVSNPDNPQLLSGLDFGNWATDRSGSTTVESIYISGDKSYIGLDNYTGQEFQILQTEGGIGCSAGKTLCSDGSCKSDCSGNGGVKGCLSSNGVCDTGEGCGCADCYDKTGPCSAGNVCKNGVCVVAEVCTVPAAVDEDNNGECDYDSSFCSHGDSACPVGVTGISVSDSNPSVGSNIVVDCTSIVKDVNSVIASVDGVGNCLLTGWVGNIRRFSCNVGLTIGNKVVRCSVDTTKSYKTGSDQTANINVVYSSCSTYITNSSCEGKPSCDWCAGCVGVKSTGSSDRCVNAGTCSAPSCFKGFCGATCDSTGGCSGSQTCDLNTCSCVSSSCNVSTDCRDGAECVDGKCGCPFGTTLCGDGTCKADCGGVPPACVDNGVCDSGEGCGCVDCKGDTDSCLSGNVCYANTDLCNCAFGLKLCADGSCSSSCTTPACSVSADCPSGAECVDGKCGCPFGTSLCGDGTCKADCGGVPPTCVDNGVCDSSEGCGCVDCYGKLDSCLSGEFCYSNSNKCGCGFGLKLCDDGSCSSSCTTPACSVSADCPSGAECRSGVCGCPGGTDLCGDGTCSSNCGGDYYAGCLNSNGVCDSGEGCHCVDCNGQQASCVPSGSCVNDFCSECVLSNANWNVSNCGIVEGNEVCVVGSGVDVSLNASGSSSCVGRVFDFRITLKDEVDVEASVPGVFDGGSVVGSWNSVWKDVSFLGLGVGDSNPVYGFSLVSQGVSVSSGNFLRVCESDIDCDGVVDGKDQCGGTGYGSGVDGVGCDPEQANCISYIDCTDVAWSECNSANQKTRSICKDPGDDPSVCCNYANRDRCACKVEPDPLGNPMPQNCKDNTQLSNWIPRSRECLIEKEFPFFSALNILIVVAILIGYYVLVKVKRRRK